MAVSGTALRAWLCDASLVTTRVRQPALNLAVEVRRDYKSPGIEPTEV